MSTALERDDRTVLSLNEHEVEQAKQFTSSVPAAIGGVLVSDLDDRGHQTPMPTELAAIVRQVLEVVSRGGTVTVGSVPKELTTTAAAKLLGVSRPTLMKLISQGDIPSHKVRSHTRVLSEDIMDYRDGQRQARLAAFEEMRDLEDELGLEEN
ncbi:helix-turn-helix domain-containing protein [Rhodococcus sp. BP-241]|nr:helix-turn-helix domain-containing protein [Rhodococcus sp. BP-241]